MKIISKKKQIEIGKRLSAIYYIAVHGYGISDKNDLDAMAKIVEYVADIAYDVGGERMMNIDVPSGVWQLEQYTRRKKAKADGKEKESQSSP